MAYARFPRHLKLAPMLGQPPRIRGAVDSHATRVAPVVISEGWAAALFATDLLAFALSSIIAVVLASHSGEQLRLGDVALSAAIAALISIASFECLGLYRRSFASAMKDELYYTTVALLVGYVPLLLLFTLDRALSTSRLVVLLSLLTAAIVVGSSRTALHALRNRSERSRPILVVGSGERLAATARLLAEDGIQDVHVHETNIDAAFQGSTGADDDAMPWITLAAELDAGSVIFTEFVAPEQLPRLLSLAQRNHLAVAFAPPRIEQYSCCSLSLSTLGPQTLIVPKPLHANAPFSRMLKRAFDLTFATAGLIVFSPIMIAAAAAVYLSSGRPLFYRQTRLGRNGKPFEMLKFRSMPVDAERNTGPMWATIGDQRCTRVGKILRRTSFDELPQILNVLLGDMSIVGPRPERPVFVEEFSEHFPRYHERHLVAPGITGWSHIHMRRNHDASQIAERLKYDLEYISNWSLYMDLSIVFHTALEFLFQGAS